MSKIQKICVGILLCIGGIIVAIWLGGWVFFIGGIAQVIESIKSTPINGWGILWGIIRIKLAVLAFWFSLFPIVGTGVAFLKEGLE